MSKIKATLLSVQGQFKNVFSGILTFLLGLTIEQTSYQYAFFAISALFLLSTIPFYIYILRSK
ncbi:MAG: hypothetical protein KC877_04435 [Candidatus Kaiserbacteria bacterium]|nr:hypothetical protein [Candidatus Kaiserbacteria bacterium]MCB9816566.1 hypothetical protein [Candidatus Nomurabacteria bacterium]